MKLVAEAEDLERPSVEILERGKLLALQGPHNSVSRFHAVWLRDNGHDARTRDPNNFQKLVTLNDIPRETRIASASVNDKRQVELVFHPDGWQTVIDSDWLWAHRYDRKDAKSALFPPNVLTWGAELADRLPSATFEAAKADERVLHGWLTGIDRYGVAVMHGVPIQSASVLDVIELFGCVRETNYGRFFEIRAVPNPTNLAASALELQAHTDNPYRDPVPTLQLFACLQNDALGGESIVVDGFRVTELLRQQSVESFRLLSEHSAEFDFHGDGDVHLRSSRPVIECSPEGQVICLRFNNRSSDALTRIPFEKMQAYYAAYRRFGELLSEPAQAVTFKLAPGQLFITDNTRVLHSRKAFSGGGRWMQGAYADKDLLKSKLSVLSKRLR